MSGTWTGIRPRVERLMSRAPAGKACLPFVEGGTRGFMMQRQTFRNKSDCWAKWWVRCQVSALPR